MRATPTKNDRIKSRLRIRLVIRGTDYEFSAEAPASQLSKELDELRKLNNAIGKTLKRESPASVTVPGPEVIFEDVPSIKAAKKTMDNIQSLFDTDWGKKARTVADVVKALEANAIPDTTTAVSVYLTRLVKKGVLRRIRKAGKYQYYKLPSS
jgi:hypothetical protein